MCGLGKTQPRRLCYKLLKAPKSDRGMALRSFLCFLRFFAAISFTAARIQKRLCFTRRFFMSRLAPARIRSSDGSGHRPHAAGFTLLELLVVIGIIVVLMSLLLPVMGRVRESGRRTKCAANLHSIGQIATQFANDHQGVFPACYRLRDTTSPPAAAAASYPFRVPQFITLDTTHDFDDTATGWPEFGTSWAVFQRYNANLDLFTCPDAQVPAHEIDLASSPTQSQYGDLISTNYFYLGGLSDQNLKIPEHVSGTNQSVSHWAKAPPAVSTSGSPLYGWLVDPANSQHVTTFPTGTAPLAQTVLAADIVYYSGSHYGNIYKINHPRTGDSTLPDFQNVLYGDGRVEGHGRDEFSYPLNDDSSTAVNAQYTFDWSMKFANGQPGFFYWGEPESTPLTLAPPPPAIPLPPDPNAGSGSGPSSPTTPTTPSSPIINNLPPAPPVISTPEGNPGPLPG